MLLNEALIAFNAFSMALQTSVLEIPFTFETYGNAEPLRRCFRSDIPASDAKNKSGVYFITDEAENILYIGKATAGNLAGEIWGKFSAPVIVDVDADVPRFENSSLAKWAGDPDLSELIKSGNIIISALVIDPPAVSSLVEVFLHTWCELGKDRALPRLNKRVG